jgi:hypothetical protein
VYQARLAGLTLNCTLGVYLFTSKGVSKEKGAQEFLSAFLL